MLRRNFGALLFAQVIPDPWFCVADISFLALDLLISLFYLHLLLQIFHHRAFHRVTVKAGDVCLPFLCLFTANAIILIVWSILAPLQWTRGTDLSSLDSFGRANTSFGSCWEATEQITPFLIVIFIIQLSALVFATVQAYFARKVSLTFFMVFHFDWCCFLVYWVKSCWLLQT